MIIIWYITHSHSTAVDCIDYFGINRTLMFQTGSRCEDNVCTSVDIIDDNIIEDVESFEISAKLVYISNSTWCHSWDEYCSSFNSRQ